MTYFEWDTVRHNRPHSFWNALYAHASTLQQLKLDFASHEVHTLPKLDVPFPKLESLKLSAYGAHGDDGTKLQTLMKNSPALKSLSFTWPNCDLVECSIRNINWDELRLPALTHLDLNGYDVTPESLAAFLARQPTIQAFHDTLESYYTTFDLDEDDIRQEEKEAEYRRINRPDSPSIPRRAVRNPFAVATTSLPNLKAVHMSDLKLSAYFNPDAGRRIQHLGVEIEYGSASRFMMVAGLEAATKNLKVLELNICIHDWRKPSQSDVEYVSRF